jgi:hypothetical protein
MVVGFLELFGFAEELSVFGLNLAADGAQTTAQPPRLISFVSLHPCSISNAPHLPTNQSNIQHPSSPLQLSFSNSSILPLRAQIIRLFLSLCQFFATQPRLQQVHLKSKSCSAPKVVGPSTPRSPPLSHASPPHPFNTDLAPRRLQIASGANIKSAVG